jgi:hypothetical protein
VVQRLGAGADFVRFLEQPLTPFVRRLMELFYGHAPLSITEDIPWKCRQLVIGTGAYGRLPVMKEVEREAKRNKAELVVLPTAQAIDVLNKNPGATNAILHVTC